MIGRPSLFTQELADTICARLAEGESLRKICAEDGMPERVTIFRWLAANDSFCDQYARARDMQADTLADEIIDIADDGQGDTYIDADGNERTNQDVIARSRLRVDARKWVAAKLKPKKYGERVTQELTGEGGGPIQHAHTVGLSDETRGFLDAMRDGSSDPGSASPVPD